jgi:splicing factor U2AF subunit
MAKKLAKLFCTEEDKVNCPFYFKIGACRYETKCLRIHNKPPYSQTILIKHMYTNSPVELAINSGNKVKEEDAMRAL